MLITTVGLLPCTGKRQYLLTCKVSRYCLLTLHGSIFVLIRCVTRLNHCYSERDLRVSVFKQHDLKMFGLKLNKILTQLKLWIAMVRHNFK